MIFFGGVSGGGGVSGDGGVVHCQGQRTQEGIKVRWITNQHKKKKQASIFSIALEDVFIDDQAAFPVYLLLTLLHAWRSRGAAKTSRLCRVR